MPLPSQLSRSPVIYELPSILERIDLRRLFDSPQSLQIELGSGDGSFLASYARLLPETSFLGTERLLGRIRKLERKAQQAGLSNVRALRIESSYFLKFLLPPHAASAIHVYFPDPWPKRKHERHRLINDDFPALAKQALGPGGIVYLRTDDSAYFQQMREVFALAKDYRLVEAPAALLSIKTDFEREFQARGIATFQVGFQLNPC